MDRARSRGADTDSDAAGELRITDCLEGAHLLMACLNELGLVVGAPPCCEDSVDAFPGISENMLDVPGPQPLQQVVAHLFLRHWITSLPGKGCVVGREECSAGERGQCGFSDAYATVIALRGKQLRHQLGQADGFGTRDGAWPA